MLPVLSPQENRLAFSQWLLKYQVLSYLKGLSLEGREKQYYVPTPAPKVWDSKSQCSLPGTFLLCPASANTFCNPRGKSQEGKTGA